MGKVKTNFKLKRKTFIRAWRKYRKKTLEQASEVLDVTPGSLSQLERGQINYTQPVLEALADYYGCEPADLIMRNPLDPESPWTVWEKLKTPQRRQAVSIMRTLAGEERKGFIESDDTGDDPSRALTGAADEGRGKHRARVSR